MNEPCVGPLAIAEVRPGLEPSTAGVPGDAHSSRRARRRWQTLGTVFVVTLMASVSPATTWAAGGATPEPGTTPTLGDPAAVPASALTNGSPFAVDPTANPASPPSPVQAGDVANSDGSVSRNGQQVIGPTRGLTPAQAQAVRAARFMARTGGQLSAHVAQTYDSDNVLCWTTANTPLKIGLYRGLNNCDRVVSTMGLQVCAAIYSTTQTWVLLQCVPSANYRENYITSTQDISFSRLCSVGRRYRTYTYAFATYGTTATGSDFSSSLYC